MLYFNGNPVTENYTNSFGPKIFMNFNSQSKIMRMSVFFKSNIKISFYFFS